MYSDSALELMRSAEKLFGQRGIDKVSLREIAVAAGQANNSAVQYHFGTKENLLQAVFEMRMPAIDAARKRYLEGITAEREADLNDLVAALLMPLPEIFNLRQLENFAMFMASISHVETTKHPFFRAEEIAPVSVEIFRGIKAHFNHLPAEAFSIRIRLAGDLFLDAVAERRRLEKSKSDPYESHHHFWLDVLNMAVAVLGSPFCRSPR